MAMTESISCVIKSAVKFEAELLRNVSCVRLKTAVLTPVKIFPGTPWQFFLLY